MGRGFAGVIVVNYGRRGGHRNIFAGLESSGGEGSGVLSDGQCVARGVRWCQRQGTEESQSWCAAERWRMVEQSPSSMG